MTLIRDAAVIGFVAATLAGGLMAAEARETRQIATTGSSAATVQDAAVAPGTLASDAAVQGQSTADRIVATPCGRKVRVVYSGYGTPSDGCAGPSR